MKLRVLLVVIATALLAGCGVTPTPSLTTPSPSVIGPSLPPLLTIENRNGPGLVVMIGTRKIADLPCAGMFVLDPVQAGIPALPWDLRLVKGDGTVLHGTVLAARDLPRWIAIIDGQWLEGTTPVMGPAVGPCPSE